MLSLLLFAALLVAVLVRVFLESRKNYPPGPFNIPFLGSLQQGRLINTVVHDEMKKLSDQYGNLVFLKILMDQPVLIIRGYDLVKEATHSRAFSGVGRPLTFKEHGLHRRMGLIFSDGDNWHQMRRFSLRALRDQGFGRKDPSTPIAWWMISRRVTWWRRSSSSSASSGPPHRFTKDNLRCLLKDLLMAGMETVNTVMEWVILILVLHPDVQARAAAEVDEVVGHDRTPAIDDMLAMPYLEAVIEETMRWMPALPIVQHATTFGATQLGGRHVPANCRVFIDLRSVLHDAAFWGDPECFRPERFLAPDAAHLKERLLGFGFGLRRCIGETHARQALFLFTAGLLQRLRLQLSPGQADPSRPGPSLVLKPQPYRITVQTRE
ncbi:cytochrome P450 1A1-like [Pollicipes pollicipes]|uniref:cytochrome P450 1A1-like n=1 Tax=Pollicipes pollicipes TaxID=41117 RepID=UPI0018854179|nr:cytochrome P450 1A1-like [Pollicipes pollicipes]